MTFSKFEKVVISGKNDFCFLYKEAAVHLKYVCNIGKKV